MKEVIVIGGGASGLVAAIYAAKSGSQVTILEKNSNCGKKILITGNGKCNYWNDDQNIAHYHTKNPEIISKIVLKQYSEEVLTLFKNIGIIPKIKEGYYYPYSNQATSIQTALIKEARLQGVEIIENVEVTSIKKEKGIFNITTTQENYQATKVILATGSKASPKTGSTGEGYQFATSLGHHVIEPLPALVQLKANVPYLKEWHGIRSDVKISLFENGQYQKSQIGEIQLTDYGISGICTLCLSGQIARGLFEKKAEEVRINFLYPFAIETVEEFIAWMDERNHQLKNRTISDLLDGLLNYKLVNLLLKISHLSKEQSWDHLTINEKYFLGTNLVAYKLPITGTNSFLEAQVCTGGIPLSEINPHTMESLITKGLYLTGEILDVDGDCGGYNLGFAWMTGIIAGSHIKGESHD